MTDLFNLLQHLITKYPNDYDLGRKVRTIVETLTESKRTVKAGPDAETKPVTDEVVTDAMKQIKPRKPKVVRTGTVTFRKKTAINSGNKKDKDRPFSTEMFDKW